MFNNRGRSRGWALVAEAPPPSLLDQYVEDHNKNFVLA